MDATTARKHSTRRRAIVGAIASKLYESLNGSAPFRSSVQSVEPRLRFWDEVQDFPAIQVGAGQETRTYDGGGFCSCVHYILLIVEGCLPNIPVASSLILAPKIFRGSL